MYNQTVVWVGTVDPFILALVGILSLLIDFVPSFIAFHRLHPNRVAILILNILFGWTILGWILLIFWAFIEPRAHSAALR